MKNKFFHAFSFFLTVSFIYGGELFVVDSINLPCSCLDTMWYPGRIKRMLCSLNYPIIFLPDGRIFMPYWEDSVCIYDAKTNETYHWVDTVNFKLKGTTTLSLSSSGEIVLPLSFAKKVALLSMEKPPQFIKSFFLTDLSFTFPVSLLMINDTLILSGYSSIPDINTKWFKVVGLEFIDLQSGKIFEQAQIYDYDSLKQDGINTTAFAFFASYSGKNSVLVNQIASPNIWEYSLAGSLIHIYDKVPNSYIPPPIWDENTDPQNKQKYWEWCDSFTSSSPPFPFRQNSFFVARGNQDKFSLDFYDLSKKKYITSFKPECVAFFGTDGEYIYLIDHYDEKRFYIYKYDVKDRRIR